MAIKGGRSVDKRDVRPERDVRGRYAWRGHSARIGVRCTPAQRRRIVARARAAGMTITDYIGRMIDAMMDRDGGDGGGGGTAA